MPFGPKRELNADGTLTCTNCEVAKPLDAFCNHKAYTTGKFPWCRACKAVMDRDYRMRQGEALKAKKRAAYRRACAGVVSFPRKTVLVGYRAWRIRNPERTVSQRQQHYKNNRAAYYSNNARRRACVNQAMPAWANKFFIEEAYRLAELRTKVLGFPWEVDHVIPLRNKIVCGLHVENNLRVVPKVVNNRKSNKFDPTLMLTRQQEVLNVL